MVLKKEQFSIPALLKRGTKYAFAQRLRMFMIMSGIFIHVSDYLCRLTGEQDKWTMNIMEVKI